MCIVYRYSCFLPPFIRKKKKKLIKIFSWHELWLHAVEKDIPSVLKKNCPDTCIDRCFDFAFLKSESRDSLLYIEPIGAVRIQYGWALEFSNSNVYSTIGLGNFLVTKMSANDLSIDPLLSS